jgi:hypothetical protein
MRNFTSKNYLFYFILQLGSIILCNNTFGQIQKEVRVSASSTMSPSSGITYYTENVLDDDLLTWWSPAAKDRNNCWLKIYFKNNVKISFMQIHAGSHYPYFKNLGNLYPKNLRVKKAILEFSDGSNLLVNLKDVDDIQRVYFPEKITNFVKIKPVEYYPSLKWPDPCISFLKFGN